MFFLIYIFLIREISETSEWKNLPRVPWFVGELHSQSIGLMLMPKACDSGVYLRRVPSSVNGAAVGINNS